MGSRRMMIRSSSGNGRSSSGEEASSSSSSSSSSSRPRACSYISNVRPENRSTLCSVMAQLTEETQPSFETTLKSKAVSANCNVKFSCVITGHPTPQVIWYKDDKQLDRYCGLPKYEIFRNGQNHSLHIYDCTVEDAAIYQLSASNSKGIVSCSGVLEVGEMNEFKIHQRYFAKLKQKPENRHREEEGKENQEPPRTISPDRTQRKRRSNMEDFLSTPSSMEEEGSEERPQTAAKESEARLQEAAVEQVEERAIVPVTNGILSAVTQGQAVSENSSKGGTCISDSAQNIFTVHQTKTPKNFVKKKIKISNSSKVAKADTQGEETKEEPEFKQSEGNSLEVMDVESIVSSSVSRNISEQHLKPATEEAFISKDENVGAVGSQKEQLTTSGSVAARKPKSTKTDSVSATEGKLAAKYDKERKDMGKHLEKWNQSRHITTSKQLQTNTVPVTQHIPNTDAVMEVDGKSNASTDGTLSGLELESVATAYERSPARPQPPCEQTGDQLSEKETTRRHKNVSEPRPALLSEVTQAHSQKNRNDAPVNLQLPTDQRPTDTRTPQTSPPERETTADGTLTPDVHRGPQAANRMTQDTWNHSRGSEESRSACFTDLQKSSTESPRVSVSTQGCSVSQQSRVDTTIKSAEGTKVQVDKKLDVKAIEKTVKMESVQKSEKAAIEKICRKTDKDAVTKDAANKETEKKKAVLKKEEKTNSDLYKVKPDKMKYAMPHDKNPPKNMDLSIHQVTDLQEIPKPVTQVISVAELLRSQIQALDATGINLLSTVLVPAHNPSTAATDTSRESKDDEKKCKLEVKKLTPDGKSETFINDLPPKNIKETLLEIYNQLNLMDQIQTQSQDGISPPVQPSQTSLVIPPISVIDTGIATDSTGHQDTARKHKEGVMDVGLETGALMQVSLNVASFSESNNVQNTFTPMMPKEELTQRFATSSDLSGNVSQELTVTTIKSNIQDYSTVKPVQDKLIGFVQNLNPEIKLNSETQWRNNETRSTAFSHSLQRIPTKSELGTDVIQQESSMVEEFPRTDSLSNSNPDLSPLLKRKNCVSPIPSATPEELASGARRKILIPKAKSEEATEATSVTENHTQKKEVSTQSSKLSPSPVMISMSPNLTRRSPLLQASAETTSPVEKLSPLLSRRKTMLDTQTPNQQLTEENSPKPEGKPAEKEKQNPFKAPQVIRKIRPETFADASGHLKLWCQFFNILSDSTIKWYRNEVEIAQIQRNAGDEAKVNLAIAQASSKDAGVYGCTITNEYGTDSTDYLLSADILAGLSLREDLGVGEEIEMTPLVFNKGVADSGIWGNKFFGRIMMQESHIGDGCAHKVWRAKVIYGLEPVFESGNMCVVKVCNPVAYGGKEESCLIDRNLDFVRQKCKIQNLAREYCKIFSAEARAIENFGPSLEVIPVYMMYRPANTIPYATVEADLMGEFQKYSILDRTGRLETRTESDVEQKCCALQHWIFQWTNGNLLLTQLEGVDRRITNVGITVKSTGHQGLSVEGNPKVFEQFFSQHQCNYFCGLLSLKSLKVFDSLMMPVKAKTSRSPLLQRKMAAGSSSPQTGRRVTGSPRLARKAEQDGSKTKHKAVKMA